MLTCTKFALDQCVSDQPVQVSSSQPAAKRLTLHAPIRMRFPAPRGAPLGSMGSAAESAFAFQGRCFVVANVQADARYRAVRSFRTIPVRTARQSQMLEISTSRHHKAPFCRQGAALTQHNTAKCRGTHEYTSTSAVLTSPARELAGGIAGTDVQGDDGLAPRNGVVWKSKPDLMGAVVLAVSWLGWPNGEHHPMGLSYVEYRHQIP
jgi:hypothetical protein